MGNYTKNQSQVNLAINEIRDGQHSGENINHARHVVQELVITSQFNQALELLESLAIARQVKTTNILWIGNYLKELYFNEKAKNLQDKFNASLLEEMLFYYLKSCKLFDPGYEKIKQHLKKIKS